MKIQHIIPLLCTAALLASACQKESDTPTEAAQPAPLGIDVALNGVTRTPVTGVSFGNTAQINVILLDAGATSDYNVIESYKLDRPDPAQLGSWLPMQGDGLMVKGSEARVLAHYPTDATLKLSADKQTITPTTLDILDIGKNNNSSSYESFRIALDAAKPTETTEVFAAKADVDFMTGVGTNVKVGISKSTTITMKHAKAMVMVHLTKAADFTGDDNLTKITFKNADGKTSLQKGSFTLADNTFIPAGETSYERTMSDFRVGTYFAMLVYPATIAADEVQMRLLVGNITYILKVPARQWEAGKVYLYNVNMVGNEVLLDRAVLIYDWPAMIEHKVDLE